MPFEFFQVPVNGKGGAVEELNAFLRSRRVVSVRQKFVKHKGEAYWGVCVEYLDGVGAAGVAVGEAGKRLPKVDYREVLGEGDFGIFSRLRDLRKVVAGEAGVEVYVVFTNEQLAAMVTRKVTTLAEMAGIEGVGDGRLGKYGERFLGELVGGGKAVGE